MRIKTIENNIALKQLKGTPRSMTIQLHPIRHRPIEKAFKYYIKCARVWYHTPLIKLYCRLNQAIINGGINASILTTN